MQFGILPFITGLTGHHSLGPHHVTDDSFCCPSGLNTEADWTSHMTDGTDADESKIQDKSLIFRFSEFLLLSVWVQRFGRGWLAAEGATPQKFSLPHLFTC